MPQQKPMKMAQLVLACLAVVLLASCTSQPGHTPTADTRPVDFFATADEKPRNPLDYFDTLKRLRLTDPQRANIRVALNKSIARIDPLMQRATDAAHALRVAMVAAPADEKLVRKKADELSKVTAELAVEITRTRNEILALLNRDQRDLFLTLERKGAELDLAMAKLSELVRFVNRINTLDRQARQSGRL
jgi:Spy/CpxP family protein refolding chaperone